MHAKHRELITDELTSYLKFGYEEFLMAQMRPQDIRKYMQDYVNSLVEREQLQIIDAFVRGMQFAKFLGGIEPPERLALLYYNVLYNKTVDMPKEEL